MNQKIHLSTLFFLCWLGTFWAPLSAQYVYRAETEIDPGNTFAEGGPYVEIKADGSILLGAGSSSLGACLLTFDNQGSISDFQTQGPGGDLYATSDNGYILANSEEISGLPYIRLAKFAANHSQQWATAVRSTASTFSLIETEKVIELSDGYAVTGNLRVGGTGQANVFLLKVNFSGAVQQFAYYPIPAPGSTYEGLEGTDMVQDANGNIWVAGKTRSASTTGTWLFKFSSAGTLLNVFQYNFNTFSIVELELASNGELLLAGYYTNGVSLAQIDLSGNVSWARNISHTTENYFFYELAISQDGGPALYGKLGISNSVARASLTKLDGSGDVLWGRSYPDPENYYVPGGLAVTPDGGYFLNYFHQTDGSQLQYVKTDANGYPGCDFEEETFTSASLSPSKTSRTWQTVSGYTTQNPSFSWTASSLSHNQLCCDAGVFCSNLQAPNSRFQHSMGTDQDEGAFSLHIYPNSSVLIGGNFTHSSSGARDQLLMRSDENGSLCRTYLQDQGAAEWALDAIQSQVNCGRMYTAGFQDVGGGNLNATISSLDADGQALWTKTLDELEWGQAYEVLEMDNGDVILCGYTNEATQGGEDMLLSRFDASGNTIWSRNIGTTANDRAYALALADDGIILVGETEIEASGMGKQIYVVKTSFSGIPIWARTLGNRFNDVGHDVVIDPQDSRIYVSGYVTSNQGDKNMALARLTNSGTVEYVQTYVLADEDEAFGLALHPSDDLVYLAGYSRTFQISLGQQAYSLVTTKAGIPVDANLYGGAGSESFQAVEVNEEGEAIFAGGATSFAPFAIRDVYMVKIDGSFTSGCWENVVEPLGQSLLIEPVTLVNVVNTDTWDDLQSVLACPEDHLYTLCSTPESSAPEEGESSAKNSVQPSPEQGILKVFPNPATNRLNLRFASPEQASGQLRLTDLQGRTVLTRPVQEVELQLDVQDLQSGVYFLNFQNGNERIVHKVVIQH